MINAAGGQPGKLGTTAFSWYPPAPLGIRPNILLSSPYRPPNRLWYNVSGSQPGKFGTPAFNHVSPTPFANTSQQCFLLPAGMATTAAAVAKKAAVVPEEAAAGRVAEP